MSVLTTILAIIGILTLLAVAYFFWRRILVQRRNEARRKMRYPPESYMRTVGNLCPDYWVMQSSSDDGRSHTCVNSFNIPVYNQTNPVCFDMDPTTGNPLNSKSFNNITDFPMKKGQESLKSRCDWIANCGITDGAKGIWSGVSELCPVK